MKFVVQPEYIKSDSFPIHNDLKKGQAIERTFERMREELIKSKENGIIRNFLIERRSSLDPVLSR
jgi:hypothetical protein